MINSTRFLARSSNRPHWLAARAGGITATAVSRAATPAGYRDQLAEMLTPVDIVPNAYMDFGNDNEGWLADWIKDETGIMPNEWLIACETRSRDLATPDGLSLDHALIAEIKTGGNEAYVKPPRKYRDQMQWQLHCTGAEKCFYAFMLRTPDFQPAWLEPQTVWVERDEERITFLESVADGLLSDFSERQAA